MLYFFIKVTKTILHFLKLTSLFIVLLTKWEKMVVGG